MKKMKKKEIKKQEHVEGNIEIEKEIKGRLNKHDNDHQCFTKKTIIFVIFSIRILPQKSSIKNSSTCTGSSIAWFIQRVTDTI